jgi:hypothetical protein
MIRTCRASQRTSIGIGVIAVLATASFALGMSGTHLLQKGDSQVVDQGLAWTLVCKRASQNLEQLRALTLRMSMSGNPQSLVRRYANLQRRQAELMNKIGGYELSLYAAQGRTECERYLALQTRFPLQGGGNSDEGYHTHRLHTAMKAMHRPVPTISGRCNPTGCDF